MLDVCTYSVDSAQLTVIYPSSSSESFLEAHRVSLGALSRGIPTRASPGARLGGPRRVWSVLFKSFEGIRSHALCKVVSWAFMYAPYQALDHENIPATMLSNLAFTVRADLRNDPVCLPSHSSGGVSDDSRSWVVHTSRVMSSHSS